MTELERPEERLPGFVAWANEARTEAWFEPVRIPLDRPGGFEWRLPDGADRDRPCSGRSCEQLNGPRPIVAVLARRVAGSTTGRLKRGPYTVTHAYCEQHADAYAVRIHDGRPLWLRRFT